jgi:TolA-binding protein
MRPISIFVLLAILSLSPILLAQQTPDPSNPQPNPDAANGQSNVEIDLAAEVQQLRQEVDQLRRELGRVQSELDELRSNRSIVEATNQPPAAATEKKPQAPVSRPPAGRGGSPRAQASNSAPASPAPTADDKTTMTVIVFRDGHRTEVRNYAIIGSTLWVYSEDDSKKIPLEQIDLPATKNANTERGVSFQLPPTP